MKRLVALEEREDTEQQPGMFSCWGRFRVASLWRRLKQFQNRRRRRNNLLRSGGLNYDPLSYAQNFDEGPYDDQEEARMLQQNFSTRFVQVSQPGARSEGCINLVRSQSLIAEHSSLVT